MLKKDFVNSNLWHIIPSVRPNSHKYTRVCVRAWASTPPMPCCEVVSQQSTDLKNPNTKFHAWYNLISKDTATKPHRQSEETKQLWRARRMAMNIRAVVACKPCGSKKTKSSEYRPCKLCKAKPLLFVNRRERQTRLVSPAKVKSRADDWLPGGTKYLLKTRDGLYLQYTLDIFDT